MPSTSKAQRKQAQQKMAAIQRQTQQDRQSKKQNTQNNKDFQDQRRAQEQAELERERAFQAEKQRLLDLEAQQKRKALEDAARIRQSRINDIREEINDYAIQADEWHEHAVHYEKMKTRPDLEDTDLLIIDSIVTTSQKAQDNIKQLVQLLQFDTTKMGRLSGTDFRLNLTCVEVSRRGYLRTEIEKLFGEFERCCEVLKERRSLAKEKRAAKSLLEDPDYLERLNILVTATRIPSDPFERAEMEELSRRYKEYVKLTTSPALHFRDYVKSLQKI